VSNLALEHPAETVLEWLREETICSGLSFRIKNIFPGMGSSTTVLDLEDSSGTKVHGLIGLALASKKPGHCLSLELH